MVGTTPMTLVREWCRTKPYSSDATHKTVAMDSSTLLPQSSRYTASTLASLHNNTTHTHYEVPTVTVTVTMTAYSTSTQYAAATMPREESMSLPWETGTLWQRIYQTSRFLLLTQITKQLAMGNIILDFWIGRRIYSWWTGNGPSSSLIDMIIEYILEDGLNVRYWSGTWNMCALVLFLACTRSWLTPGIRYFNVLRRSRKGAIRHSQAGTRMRFDTRH